MSTVNETVDVEVDLSTAYNQWTQFESFPQFMEGVEEVRQLDDTTTHWVTKFGGVKREFDAVITEQRPDERIAWRSVDGPTHDGVVTFHRLDGSRTRVAAQMDVEPEGVAEKVGDVVRAPAVRVKQDLKSFKSFIESRPQGETGAWRGEVGRPDDPPGGGNLVT